MSRSLARRSWLARSSFLLLIAAAAAACSSSSSSPSSSGDDAAPDSTAESGSGSDDGSSSDAPSSDAPGTLSDANDAGNADSPGPAPDAPADSPSDHEGGSSPEASATDAPSSSDAPADASPDAPADSPVEASVDATADGSPDASGPTIRLFDGNSPGGILRGRSGIDALCAAASQADGGPGSAHVHGFITVTDTDEIKDMPANYGVPTNGLIVSMTGVVVAADWAHLLSGSVENALSSADVILSGDFWYSGSNPDGSIATKAVDGGAHPFTCSGWTDGSTLFDGQYGLAYSTDSNWMTAGGQATCGLASYHVLCLGW